MVDMGEKEETRKELATRIDKSHKLCSAWPYSDGNAW